MGLDMYLNKKIYIGADYGHRKITGNVFIFQDSKPIKINFTKINTIEESVGYWRKANAIHKWFVENVQDGVDNCGEYYVPINKLQELLALCNLVKKHPKKAPELLPSTSGFFFGSTEYDQYYFEDIDYTIELLNEILSEEDENGEYYYQSSW